MSKYNELSKTLSEKIILEKKTGKFNKVGFDGENAVRRIDNPHDKSTAWRTAFIRDVDKILNCPFYNRYHDKTQVISLNKNDDLSHRSLHVQLVSRTARTIGSALNLNTDLIEAIALGHDMGHTPFGHTGEVFLDKLYSEHTNLHFAHNVHSIRVLDKIFPLNLTLQTLDGIAGHNGEIELAKYCPQNLSTFEEFDKKIDLCYQNSQQVKTFSPSTLEGCVVRLCDIIAYLGKDRHDAEMNDIIEQKDFTDYGLGIINAQIVNNLCVNVIENSYGKDYIMMDQFHFDALSKYKCENYQNIYKNAKVQENEKVLGEMFAILYEKLLFDLKNGIKSSPIYTHHVIPLSNDYYQRKRTAPYADTEFNLIVVDFIASMTDDFFVQLFNHLFPTSNLSIKYKDYF